MVSQYNVTRSKIHRFNLSVNSPYLHDVVCTCKGESKVAAKAILPLGINTYRALVYNNCARTLLASSIRQGKSMPAFDPFLYKKYQSFCDRIFHDEIIPILQEFQYSYDHWYNHLERTKQEEIDELDKNPSNAKLWSYVYNNFSKRELQLWIEDQKARNISAPGANVKYVMGPIIWQLEHLFATKFHGYCGSANYDDLRDYYNGCLQKGLTVVAQGDGSGFDLSQTHEAKYIDRLIYNWLADNGKIYHVDPELFRHLSTMRFRMLNLQTYVDGRVMSLGTITLDATVGSGSPDTTFGNTLRMAIYNRFVAEEILGLKPHEYGLKVKGDDFVAMFTEEYRNKLERAYYEFFVSPKEFDEVNDDQKPIKSGQILKFLSLGDYESIDFCSTNVLHRKGVMLILRKLDRFPLANWSIKALSYSDYEMMEYYNALAFSYDAWAKGLPFYGDYAEVFRYHALGLSRKLKKRDKNYEVLLLATRSKITEDKRKTLRTSELACRPSHREDHHFGRDYAFGLLEKKQTVGNVEPEIVYDYILEKYGIDRYTLGTHINKLKTGFLYDELGNHDYTNNNIMNVSSDTGQTLSSHIHSNDWLLWLLGVPNSLTEWAFTLWATLT